MTNEYNSCVYPKYNEHGIVIICIYVDDMLIFGTSIKVIKPTKDFLNPKFKMKDLGEADLIIGGQSEQNLNLVFPLIKLVMLKRF